MAFCHRDPNLSERPRGSLLLERRESEDSPSPSRELPNEDSTLSVPKPCPLPVGVHMHSTGALHTPPKCLKPSYGAPIARYCTVVQDSVADDWFVMEVLHSAYPTLLLRSAVRQSPVVECCRDYHSKKCLLTTRGSLRYLALISISLTHPSPICSPICGGEGTEEIFGPLYPSLPGSEV